MCRCLDAASWCNLKCTSAHALLLTHPDAFSLHVILLQKNCVMFSSHIFRLWGRKQLLPAPARFTTKTLKKKKRQSYLTIINAHVNMLRLFVSKIHSDVWTERRRAEPIFPSSEEFFSSTILFQAAVACFSVWLQGKMSLVQLIETKRDRTSGRTRTTKGLSDRPATHCVRVSFVSITCTTHSCVFRSLSCRLQCVWEL